MLNSFIQNGSHIIPLVCPSQKAQEGLFQAAVPLPLGLVTSLDQLGLVNNGMPQNCSAKISSYWSDKSIKWVALEFFGDTLNAQYALAISNCVPPKEASNNGINTCIKNNVITINTKDTSFTFDLNSANFKWACPHTGTDIKNGCLALYAQHDNLLEGKVKSHQLESFVNLADGSIQKIALQVSLTHQEPSTNILLHSTLTFTLYQNPNLLNIKHRLHNPQAAKHPNGHWDLGDENAVQFHSASMVFEFSSISSLTLKKHEYEQWQEISDRAFALIQHSSGGDAWQSPVHVDKDNNVALKYQGATLYNADGSITILARANPSIRINAEFSLGMEQFWQNFPKALSVDKNKVAFELFPANEQLHELQGGESKTHNIWLRHESNEAQSSQVILPQQLSIHSDWLNVASQSHFGFYSKNAVALLDDVISAGISGPNNFFQKRENIDEYGWRNFGDLYADHETAYYQGTDLFVSHYNNQYDPIFGFLKQYLISGDIAWFELADDLAKHVKDIDIYHTTEDKAEYNGGLFWHTDHYLPAFTSSHRSYSKLQDSNAYQDHAGGGGPGGQHCYTTGLALHYQLTGDESSKQAVLTLCNWISCFYEGTNTCFELLLALKNRDAAGTKNHFTGQYPLDRGTANYVVALLDSFELTQDRDYLIRVEHIISHTVHPNEDVTLRNLSDVENTWFYTVFLQAVCRYLLLKQQMEELDTHLYYARDCLINFANWMVNNEYMYLDKPEILEYPNDTWTAQDLRKASVLAAAYYFSPDNEQHYLDKAEYFENQVASRLNNSESKTYTRIMVLVLQNCGLVDFYKNHPQLQKMASYQSNWPAPQYENRGLFTSFIKVMSKRLIKLSLKNEFNWLKTRLK
ncbi:hypothetical protein [Paraglaciecola hydrolytica]|uniref:Uncharacterized protein n=1 Tax=Paraglaciecola hydrolytica TaxID=1799789 RepID=A0A135ZZT9_9ALTE|nr:hypothetical protein [Paraglaciecola hydrolytica]KXI28516.1 hypothetical protein AX660_15615 [Paraglaciecola hydrolytica]